MAVEIPDVLIQRLREAGLSTRRFLKLDGKAAVEKDWPHKLYEPEELTRVWGGNYGVAAGDGLVLIDGDKEPLVSWLRHHIPSTFQVLSPGHKTPHYYLKLKNGKPENLVLYWGFDEKGQRRVIGHLQAERKYLVGPGSKHPDGGLYEILNNAAIAEVSWQQLRTILKPFTRKNIEEVEKSAVEEKQRSGVELSILRVVPLAGLKRQGDEYYGAHSIHGSTTGRNFWVNPSKNVWHCFRHGTGGGPLLWLAVEEGIIDCEEAVPGALRDERFKETLRKAVERGYIKQAQINASSKMERGKVVKRVCQLITDNFIAEEIYDPPKPPEFVIYHFNEGRFETVKEIILGETDKAGRKVVHRPIFNAHVKKGMVILPRKPVACSIEEVVDEAFSLVFDGFDPCGKDDELKLIVLIAISSWILDKEKPSVPIAGVGVFAPIIGIRGPSGSGKNRLSNLLRFLLYHPFYDVSTHRIPSLYRPLDLWKGALVMDEADIKSSGETSSLIHFLNARATGTPIGRQNPDRPSKCDAFESFGITVVAQRRHFDDNATESRTIPFYTDVSDKGLPTLETEDIIRKGLELQDKLLYIRMHYWKDINIEKKLWVKDVIDPRINSALLPIMALSKYAPKLEEMVAASISSIARVRRELKSQSDDGIIINYLWERLENQLFGLHNNLYYVGCERQKEKSIGGEEEEYVIPLTASKIAEDLKFSRKGVRKILTSLNIAPDDAPQRFRVGKRPYRGIFFEPKKLEKRLREFVVDYETNRLYEILGLPVPDVPHVPNSTPLGEIRQPSLQQFLLGGESGFSFGNNLNVAKSQAKAREVESGTTGTSGTQGDGTPKTGDFNGLIDRKLAGSMSPSRFSQNPLWECDGFHAVGPMATPEKNYGKTVSGLFEYLKVEKTNIISDTDVANVLNWYWTRDCHERVKQKLVGDGYLKPFGSGKFLVVENPNPEKEPLKARNEAKEAIVSKLKAKWTHDLTREEIIDRLVHLGLSQAEAESWFARLAGTELFWYDKDGKTFWGLA